MNNKVSKFDLENVANRFNFIELGPKLTSNVMCIGLHVSVSATRGNQTGLAKLDLLGQIK